MYVIKQEMETTESPDHPLIVSQLSPRFEVGYWLQEKPDELPTWHLEAEAITRDEAREFCSWLNGGERPADTEWIFHNLVLAVGSDPIIQGGFADFITAAKYATKLKTQFGDEAEYWSLEVRPGRVIQVEKYLLNELMIKEK